MMDWITVSGVAFVVLIFFLLARAKRYRVERKNDYEKLRNEANEKELREELVVEEEPTGKGGFLGNLITALLVGIVGIYFAPLISEQVIRAQVGDITSSTKTIIGLTSLFYTLAIAATAIMFALAGVINLVGEEPQKNDYEKLRDNANRKELKKNEN